VRIGSECYALPVVCVREVASFGEVAPLPGAPKKISGLRNMQGRIVPIVDLAGLLGVVGDEQPQQIVIAEDEDRIAGLAVDAVTGVEVISDAGHDVGSPHLTGAALVDGTLVGVIDLPAVLDAVHSDGSR
jgi:purine-binding chemotaxis protein CheW